MIHEKLYPLPPNDFIVIAGTLIHTESAGFTLSFHSNRSRVIKTLTLVNCHVASHVRKFGPQTEPKLPQMRKLFATRIHRQGTLAFLLRNGRAQTRVKLYGLFIRQDAPRPGLESCRPLFKTHPDDRLNTFRQVDVCPQQQIATIHNSRALCHTLVY